MPIMLCLKHSFAVLPCFQTYKNLRYIHKLTLNMNSAYIHHSDGDDQFKLTFLYQKKEIGVDRQFNFSRLLAESIDTFVGRISTNVGKVVQKKVKKQNKKEKQEEASNVDLEVKILNNGISVPGSLTCHDVFFKQPLQQPLILQVEDVHYSIIINSPWIDALGLPNSIMSGFSVYASKFEGRFIDKLKSSFSWMRSSKVPVTNKNNQDYWELVGSNYIYVTSDKDIGYKLKLICIPKNQYLVGPLVEVESDSVVEAGPGICPFETRHAFTKTKLSSGSFRVVTYNILADFYATTDDAKDILFSYCAKYALTIDYRKQLFVKEIMGYNADIICLQEVDCKVYDIDLTAVLGNAGYEGHFVKKNSAGEGISCFYSTARFKHLESHSINISEELKSHKEYCSHIWKTIEKNAALTTRICDLGTCAQATVLQSLDQRGEILVIGNTHLYFHPNADHIRLLQAGTIIAFLQEIVKSVAKKHAGHHVSLLLCGDFNSVPECGIYKLMTTNEVPEDFIDWKSTEEEAVQGLTLTQPYTLASACGTPKYTNFTVGFADCLDYIFYQTDRLKVEQVVPMPSEEELKLHSAIPSIVFPSDHIALVADLKWR